MMHRPHYADLRVAVAALLCVLIFLATLGLGIEIGKAVARQDYDRFERDILAYWQIADAMLHTSAMSAVARRRDARARQARRQLLYRCPDRGRAGGKQLTYAVTCRGRRVSLAS